MLVHPDDKFFHCPNCQRRHRVDEPCISNPNEMEVQADDHDLPRATQHAFEALLVSNAARPTCFRFAGEIVRLTHDETGRVRLETMTFPRMRHMMASAAQWVTTSKPSTPGGVGVKRPAEPPRTVIENMLATPIKCGTAAGAPGGCAGPGVLGIRQACRNARLRPDVWLAVFACGELGGCARA